MEGVKKEVFEEAKTFRQKLKECQKDLKKTHAQDLEMLG